MMYTFKIKKIDPVYSQAEHGYFIDVEVEIYKVTKEEGKEDVLDLYDTKKFGYPLGTTKEKIFSEFTKVCATLESDQKLKADNAQLDKHLADVQALKEELTPSKE